MVKQFICRSGVALYITTVNNMQDLLFPFSIVSLVNLLPSRIRIFGKKELTIFFIFVFGYFFPDLPFTTIPTLCLVSNLVNQVEIYKGGIPNRYNQFIQNRQPDFGLNIQSFIVVFTDFDPFCFSS